VPTHETTKKIFAHHLLATAQQKDGETIDKFVLQLDGLSKNCTFVAVNDQAYSDDMKRNSFISGLSSGFIREHLLENQTLTFTQAYEKARALEVAKQTSETYYLHTLTLSTAAVQQNKQLRVTLYTIFAK